MLQAWWQWMEDSSVATTIRQSAWLYPALEIVHITGIVLLVGPAFLFDLRLLGISAAIPVSALERYLLVWSRRALLLVIPSGILLFTTNAAALAADSVFHTKLLLLLAAALNVLFFHKVTYKDVRKWDVSVSAPRAAKLSAIASMIIWIAIIACGRLLAY